MKKIINLFSRNKKVDVSNETSKGFSSSYVAFPVGYNIDNYLSGKSVNPEVLFRYYHTVSPIATAIDMIADGVTDIQIHLKDTKNSELRDELEPMRLLKKPNCLQTYRGFIKELATNFLVAGNTFIKMTGDIEKPPLETFNISPCLVSATLGDDGIVSEYRVNRYSSSEMVYKRLIEFTKNNCLRYVTDDRMNELVHIRDFNNDYDESHQIYGVSKMRALILEIEQLMKANVFNYSVLSRSGKISMAVVVKNPTSPEQFEQIKSDVNNKWSGAERAGQVAVINGSDIDIKELSKTQRDMDYLNLKTELNKLIYTRYGIPLPLVSDKVMTFNNLATSNFIFYDNAVIPLVNIIFDAFTLHLLPRYKNLFDLVKFDLVSRDIQALETRQNERVKTLSEIGVLTQNELRRELGFDDIDGGDVLPLSAIKSVKHFTKEDLGDSAKLSGLYND